LTGIDLEKETADKARREQVAPDCACGGRVLIDERLNAEDKAGIEFGLLPSRVRHQHRSNCCKRKLEEARR